ncbi:hypothetical protein [Chitinophaga sp. CF418]|uniref:hypothetical protein n=1 Tax=Chitinophaga sp. CF418 TaxID=1855287 RepID=UPI00091B6F92|nr:hypothetical protein [Chitinophaga sp. CF418]SHN45493.1 hypothetical protein SAMN05216311_12075 [Chitinophaga sp. CF418]
MPKREINGAEYNDTVVEEWIEYLEIHKFPDQDFTEINSEGVYHIGKLFVSNLTSSPILRISFKNCIFSDDVIFSAIEYETIDFTDCIFEKKVLFKGGDFKKNIAFKGGSVKERMEISGGIFSGLLLSLNCEELHIANAKFNDLAIRNIEEKTIVTIQKLLIKFNGIFGNISLNGIKLVEAELTGTIHKDVEFTLMDSHFTNLKLNKLFNNGKLRLFDLSPFSENEQKTSLFINNSNLAKTEFFSIDIAKIGSFGITNSFLIECTFVNLGWPAKFFGALPELNNEQLLDRREMFRQLKYSYAKQGDTITEHKFHGFEMNAQMHYLRKKRWNQPGRNIFKKWSMHRQTSLVLWVSRLTSNYGQSFLAPLITLALLGILSFSGMVYWGYIKELAPDFNLSWDRILITIAHFLYFINPIKRLDAQSINGGLIIDLGMRIITSYCIYNFIRATRRFVK